MTDKKQRPRYSPEVRERAVRMVEEHGAGNAPQSDVWPEFLDDTGKSLTNEVPLIGEYSAIMHIVFDNMVDVHFQRLQEGTKFFCMEGARKIACGRVTSLSIS